MWDIDIKKGLDKLSSEVFKYGCGVIDRIYPVRDGIVFELSTHQIYQYNVTEDTLTEIV